MSALTREYTRTWIADNIVPETTPLSPDSVAVAEFVEQLLSDAEDSGFDRDAMEEDGDDLADLIAKALEPSNDNEENDPSEEAGG